MKTLFITEPDTKDQNSAIAYLTNYLPQDVPVEIKIAETEPWIMLSLTYDESIMDEDLLFEGISYGDYAIATGN